MSRLIKPELVKFNYSRLDARIRESGMTRGEVARAAGCLSKYGFKNMLRGTWSPWASEILKVQKVLRCSLRDMMDIDGVRFREMPEVLDFSGTRLTYRPLREFLGTMGETARSALGDYLGEFALCNLTGDRDMNMKTIAVVCKYLRLPPDCVMKFE